MIQPGRTRAPRAALAAALDVAAAADLAGVDLAEAAPAYDHAELPTNGAASVIHESPGPLAPRRPG
jgi:arginase family enzyme